ncbi:MAG TPA: hypothetical protein VHO25_10770, partial [Polyangiaceae bacterium]|nr:hypothetical protein [Polyangiaceae bacterium]
MRGSTRILTALAQLLLLACSSGALDVGARNTSAGTDGGALPEPRLTNRANSLPIGIEDVNNSPMSSATYRALLRFVPDATVSIDRLYFGFNVRGASCRDPGAATDGDGDGGVLVASLVNIDSTTGLPSTPIDREEVGACARYDEVQAAIGSTPVLVWVNLTATLDGGKMYGLVIENGATNPTVDYFSFHMPLADVQLAGPQAS